METKSNQRELTCQTLKCQMDSLDRHQDELQREVNSLKEMINLLISYENECVEKLDLAGAKQTRNRITHLTQMETQLCQKMISTKTDKQYLQISQEQDELIDCFDQCWSQYLNNLVSQLAQSQNKLRGFQKLGKLEAIQKFDTQKAKGFKASSKLTNLKRKVIGLMRFHQYEEAEFENNKAIKLEQQQRQQWQAKVEQRKRNALEKLTKKYLKQFEVLRSKNQDLLYQKMKERDNKYEILLKKNQVKQLQASRTNREMFKSMSGTALNTKRFL